MERESGRLYRPGPKRIKGDGTVRETLDPAPFLKDVQRRINARIFNRVTFPRFLQGGIKDRQSPRDYVRNAGLHSGAKILINEDITRFYPSISARRVRRIWLDFFRFPREIADLLTLLTTHDGVLPQGAPTSTYLANLVFWDTEPEFAASMARAGLRYSRYVDDISVSSARALTRREIQDVIGGIRSQCTKLGFRLKKSKHAIFSAARPMLVNGLVVNEKVSLQRSERSKLRAARRALAVLATTERATSEYARMFRSVRGRHGPLGRMHPNLVARIKQALDEIAPLPKDEADGCST
ncbi:MAG: RNA-directed DNA polymerase [Gammaproteobacteria bacterium]|nr:RNA-directed DNA polymerase [Gammaproteobacteria bacterium]